jgi:hypothetical protein
MSQTSNEIRMAKRRSRSIWIRLFPRGLGADLPRVNGPSANIRFASDICPEHWNNIIIFGLCWRHNADGSLKSTFTKKV